MRFLKATKCWRLLRAPLTVELARVTLDEVDYHVLLTLGRVVTDKNVVVVPVICNLEL